ncbi:NAD-dependent epimerase/dehydratase family protein [bacterium]|jgi:nucleoside-diphosphate-sugar epimerase|nr:NAD-dependent epimerase/dehydratase family protein [bacterium]
MKRKFIHLLNKIRETRKKRQQTQMLLDLIFGACSIYLANHLMTINLSTKNLLTLIAIVPTTRIAINIVMGSYKQLWRYINYKEILNILINISFTSSLLLIINIIYKALPTDVIFLEASLFILLALSFRGGRKLFYNSKQTSKTHNTTKVKSKKCLLIGAGESANNLIQNIQKNKIPITFMACLDDDKKKIGAEIQKIKILGATDQLSFYVQKLEIDLVIVAMPSAPQFNIQKIVSSARKCNTRVKVIPKVSQLYVKQDEQMNFNFTIDDLIDSKEFVNKKSHTDKKSITLVTGGAGYIGTHLVKKLLDNGQKVRVLDNFIFGKSYLPEYFNHPNLEIINGNIANIQDVVTSLKGVDTVIALAALVGDPACGINAEETLNLNYEATKVLIETANFYGVKRIVFASSCSVYGESGSEFLTEESQLNPVSLYAKTRIMSEDIIFSRCGKVEPVVLRLSTVFGYSPRMRYDLVVNTLAIRAHVDKKFSVFGGNQWRPFVHCDDVAQAFFLASNAPSENVKNQIFNVGSNDMNFTIKNIGEKIHEMMPQAKFEISDDIVDPRNYKVNFDKINSLLNFKKQYDIESGVNQIIKKASENESLKNYKDSVFSNFTTTEKLYSE